MSTLKVEVVKIEQILPHPNADRLEIAQINGWQCVVGKGTYQPGDLAVYIPIDSVLPEHIEQSLFPPDSKIKLSNHRVKTIKIRGAVSQGMLARFESVGLSPHEEGYDLTSKLGIKKFEPPIHHGLGKMDGRSPKWVHPNFDKYTSIENMKNYPKVFEKGEEVVITEKIHGTNFRAGWVPRVPRSWLGRLLVKLIPKRWQLWEFVYGSHNVLLDNKHLAESENVYAEAVNLYDLMNKLKPGEVVYGEIYGSGVQKNYLYGCKQGERKFVLFDVKRNGRFLNWGDLTGFAWVNNLPLIPSLWEGPFNLEIAKELTKGDSVLSPMQKIREGVVIKPMEEQGSLVGRKILKLISDDYLLRDNSDFH